MESLSFSYTNKLSSSDIFFDIEQEEFDDNYTVDSYDLLMMYSYLIQGKSARSHGMSSCPVIVTDKSMTVNLDFYIHANPIDHPFSLSATQGIISGQSLYKGRKEIPIIIEMSNEVDLGIRIDKIHSYEWDTPSFNKKGMIKHPDVSFEGTKLIFSEITFGVIWIDVSYTAYKYTVSIEKFFDGSEVQEGLGYYGNYQFSSPVDGSYLGTPPDGLVSAFVGEPPEQYGFSGGEDSNYGWVYADFSSVLTLEYTDFDGKDASVNHHLKIPKCVESLLGTCVDGFGNFDTVIINSPGSGRVLIFFNPCDGKVLGIKELKDGK